MTTRHEFLAQLHELIKPTVYLEVGVQHGWSLQLSKAPISIGIDPNPLVQVTLQPHHAVVKMTSDDYFAEDWGSVGPSGANQAIDLAFIDGMHLAEFAWRDFINIEKYSHVGTVVVFDDVLPTNTEMASRTMCPGDWTGDVWRVPYVLQQWNDLVVQWVDTTPTGTCVVTGFDQAWTSLRAEIELTHEELDVPSWVIDRRHALPAPVILDNLRDRGFAK